MNTINYKINDNGTIRDMTDAEKALIDSSQESATAETKAREDAEAQAKIDKEAGKTKLKDLGLTEDEIKALIGEQ
tara:strand:+ start:597 stop:821 length:225 start_codon:yes stop_codon:yes gene_type:complete